MFTKMAASKLKFKCIYTENIYVKIESFIYKIMFNQNLIKIKQLENENTISNNPIPKIVNFESMQIESDEFINGNFNNGANSSMSNNSLPQGPTKGKKLAC